MSKLSLDRTNLTKIRNVAGYLLVSSVLSAVISLITDNPTLFGSLTPAINLLLVGIRELFKKPE